MQGINLERILPIEDEDRKEVSELKSQIGQYKLSILYTVFTLIGFLAGIIVGLNTL